MNHTLLNRDQHGIYQRDGFLILRDFVASSLLEDWEKTVIAFYCTQALKFSQLRNRFTKGSDPSKYTTMQDLDLAVRLLEDESKDAAYQVRRMLTNTPGAAAFLTNGAILSLVSELLSCPSHLIQGFGPNLYYNLPDATRLVYHWHIEAHYMPRRRRVLNLWFPIFGKKTAENGTMLMRRGSHQNNDYDYSFYRGYDRDSVSRPNHWTQFEIPESQLAEFEIVPMELGRGDLVVFGKDLVHSSSVNRTEHTSFHTGIRLWDIRKDLTLSANLGAAPYVDDLGHPGLVPLDIVE